MKQNFYVPQLVGSKPKEEKPKIDLMEPAPVNYDSNKEYNQDILTTVPEHLMNLVIRDNFVLVRLFKYESEFKTEGGLIIEDFEFMQTEAGQVKARMATNPYQKRAVVINRGHVNMESEFYKKLMFGTIIHLSTNKLEAFKVYKDKRGEDNQGFALINVGAIEAIEN